MTQISPEHREYLLPMLNSIDNNIQVLATRIGWIRSRVLAIEDEAGAAPLDVDALIADMPVAVLATDGGPVVAYAMRVEAYLRDRLASISSPREPEPQSNYESVSDQPRTEVGRDLSSGKERSVTTTNTDPRPPTTIGQEFWADRVNEAAILCCNEHYDREHKNTIPPCAGAMQEARWWADAFGLAMWKDV